MTNSEIEQIAIKVLGNGGLAKFFAIYSYSINEEDVKKINAMRIIWLQDLEKAKEIYQLLKWKNFCNWKLIMTKETIWESKYEKNFNINTVGDYCPEVIIF